MKAFILHFYLETRAGFRRKQQLFLNYFFPIGFFLMMGTIMPQLNPLFLDDMIPAMLIFSVMASTFLGIPDTIVGGRTGGVLRGYKVNGVPAVSVISLPILSSLVHMLIVSTIIMILSPLLFKAPVPSDIRLLVPVLLLTIFACGGISVLIGVAASSSRSATMLAQIFFIPSMLIGGLMIPYNVLPDGIKPFALLLPSTHSMNLFNTLCWNRTSAPESGLSVSVLLGTGLLTFILSIALFRWDGRQNGRN